MGKLEEIYAIGAMGWETSSQSDFSSKRALLKASSGKFASGQL
jgi:hypothetical protein